MRFFKKWPVRVVLFIMGFLMINAVIEFLFLRINKDSLLVMHDLSTTKNIEIAFVGSSLSRNHVSNAVIENHLGWNSFNLSVGTARNATNYAMMRELFKNQTPKVIVLVCDPLVDIKYQGREEPVIVEAGLRSFLHGWDIKLPYIIENCINYGGDIDRLFPWRVWFPKDYRDFKANIKAKFDWDSYYDSILRLFPTHDGKGFRPEQVGMTTDINKEELFAAMTRKAKPYDSCDESGLEFTLMRMEKLCSSNNCELIVLATPQLSQVLLGDKRYDQCYKIETEICKKYNIPFWNFAYVEDELLPDMTPYFFRDGHFDIEGAEIFSQALGKVLKEHLNGEDVSHYFITAKEYADKRDYILNSWYTVSKKNQKITYTADCIYGSHVKPEYQFTAVDKNGEETQLQCYYSTSKCTVDAKDMEGKTIRIYARNAEDLSQEPILAIKK